MTNKNGSKIHNDEFTLNHPVQHKLLHNSCWSYTTCVRDLNPWLRIMWMWPAKVYISKSTFAIWCQVKQRCPLALIKHLSTLSYSNNVDKCVNIPIFIWEVLKIKRTPRLYLIISVRRVRLFNSMFLIKGNRCATSPKWHTLTSLLTICLFPWVFFLATTPLLCLPLNDDISKRHLGWDRGLSPGCRPRVITFPRKRSQRSGEGFRLVRWMTLGCVFELRVTIRELESLLT